MISIEAVLAEAKKNDRVCPQPQRWNELYQLLPNRQRKGNAWEPPLPLILAAWWDTPALPKKLRFEEHLRWAETHGCLELIDSFICALAEDQWHHIGD